MRPKRKAFAGAGTPKKRRWPLLVAIVGGSGSGKTWLACRLQRRLAPRAARVSLDDFYLDRSRLSSGRRARLNFDHPRSIDWAEFERVLGRLSAGRSARAPSYDFRTHCRARTPKLLAPQRIILIEGLWLLRRPALRRLFPVRIYIECPFRRRLRRRLSRDLATRGRSRASIQEQFEQTVEPMHHRYVAPQARWANLVLRDSGQLRPALGLIRTQLAWE